jgi:hypothetical protein
MPGTHSHPVHADAVLTAQSELISVEEAGRLAGLLGLLADPGPVANPVRFGRGRTAVRR